MSDRAAPEARDSARAECLLCRKPSAFCLCATIPRIEARTGITVLQHPRERRHPIGTARFVELGLGARVVCPVRADRSLVCSAELPEGTAVLFPGETASEISELDPSSRPRHLLVVDGTWNHARRLWRANPWIEALPQVRIEPSAPSRYRIRREPERHYLSTVEAVVEALRVLEPDLEGLESLLAAFDGMIDRQIEWATSVSRTPRTRSRARRSAHRLPRALHEGYEDLVVVYAEWGEPAHAPLETARTVLQWAAVRPSTGETFERRLAPKNPRAAAYAARLGLDRGEITGEEAALDGLRAFVGERGCVAAWDRAPLLHLRPLLDGAGALSLRDVYRTVRGPTGGALEVVLAREGVAPRALPMAGRAGERLANASALVRFLRELRPRSLAGPEEALAVIEDG